VIETISATRAHGGTQGVYRHASVATGTDMSFSVYVPPHAPGAALPVVWYLSGLTCTPANVTEKGEFRAACAELGLIFVAPDTSPRGDGVADDPDGAYDFGLAQASTSTRPNRPSRHTIECGATLPRSCPRSSPRTSPRTWRASRSWAIRWAGTAR
jgi:S-formylglutathione hydrolase